MALKHYEGFQNCTKSIWTRKQQHCRHSSFTELQRGSGVKERWLRSLSPFLRSSPFQQRYGGLAAGHPNSAVIVAPTVGVRLNVETAVTRFLCGGVSCCSGLDTQTLIIVNRLNFKCFIFKKDKHG